MNIKKLIEEINKITEDELVDEFDDVEITDTDVNDITDVEDKKSNTTTELDAKTKISRALDVLKEAVEDFKNATVEEVDIINDSALLAKIENLDGIITEIESVLTGDTPKEKEVNDEELEEVEDAEDSEQEEEVDFDDEATIDLFNNEEE